MHQVHIGFSTVLSGDEMIRYFDLDPNHEDGLPRFSQNFGIGYIEQGSFEVYGKDEYEQFDFDASFLKKLFPFELDGEILSRIDLTNAKCVFFIECGKIEKTSNDDLTLLGTMNIEKYDFER